jgi:hypothetical protein
MQLADQLSKFSRALSLCEIERFQSHRSEVFNRLLGTIIACNIHVSPEIDSSSVDVDSNHVCS